MRRGINYYLRPWFADVAKALLSEKLGFWTILNKQGHKYSCQYLHVVVCWIRVYSVLLFGLWRAAHGSWGQIGVQADDAGVFYIKGSLFHT